VAYEGFPIETDPTTLAEEAFSWLQSRPGWESWVPSSPNFDAGSIEAHARIAAEVRDIAATRPDELMVRVAALSGIFPTSPSTATVTATVSAIDAQGYTLEAGTVVGVQTTGDVVVRFATVDDAVILPGATAITNVQLVAEEEGAASSGVGAAGTVATIIDRTVPWATVTLAGQSAGGADGQTLADFLDDAVAELALQAPRPIVPRDFAVFAQRHPSVERALAIDLYQPPAPYGPAELTNVARCLTVFVVDEAGLDPGANVRAEVLTDLRARRESTFLVYVAPPTYQAVSVAYSGRVVSGSDPAEVLTRANAELASYLSPATFGVSPFARTSEWTTTADRVRRTELYAVLNGVDGIDYVDDTLTINGAASDLVLTGGRVVLPTAGTMTGVLV
jgi:hypothetical protein